VSMYLSSKYVHKESQKPIDVPFPHIGTDESGKGDYFGPMVVVGVWVDESISRKLESLGVRDSKLLSDKRCRELAAQIRTMCKGKYREGEIPPQRYNKNYIKSSLPKVKLLE